MSTHLATYLLYDLPMHKYRAPAVICQFIFTKCNFLPLVQVLIVLYWYIFFMPTVYELTGNSKISSRLPPNALLLLSFNIGSL